MKSGWMHVHGWRPFGADLFIHWSVAVALVMGLGLVARDPAFMALVLVSYFVNLIVHESGHAWMARKLGMRVGALEFSAFHGRCSYSGRDIPQLDHVRIALAGPLAQLALAATVIALSLVPAIRDLDAFGPVLVFAGYFNVVWAGMNLLPGRGLDGEVAWRAIPLLWKRRRPKSGSGKRPNPLRRVK
jgi:Zn-dependent protease